MKVTKKVEETITHERVVARVCDLCGFEGTDDWNAGTYSVNDTEVKVTVHQREGTECWDGGGGTEFDVDICPECFKCRLVPWLREQGAEVAETEWGW